MGISSNIEDIYSKGIKWVKIRFTSKSPNFRWVKRKLLGKGTI